jgi:hypothetical protein
MDRITEIGNTAKELSFKFLGDRIQATLVLAGTVLVIYCSYKYLLKSK